MKAILTLIAVIFFGTMAMAQDVSKDVKVETITVSVEMDVTLQKEVEKEAKVARLYRYKNSRVKKALSFKTKRNKSKMA